jgi:hypothetical protein
MSYTITLLDSEGLRHDNDTVETSTLALEIFKYHLDLWGGFSKVDIHVVWGSKIQNNYGCTLHINKIEEVEKYFEDKKCIFSIKLRNSGFLPPTTYQIRVNNNLVPYTYDDVKHDEEYDEDEDDDDELKNHHLTFKDLNKNNWKDVANVLKINPDSSDPENVLRRTVRKYRLGWIQSLVTDNGMIVIDIKYYNDDNYRFMFAIQHIEEIKTMHYVKVVIDYRIAPYVGETRQLSLVFSDDECAFEFQKDLNLLIA